MSDIEELIFLVFDATGRAVTLYEKEVVLTPPQARCRGYEASLLNSKMIQCIQENFPEDWKFGV
jgi:hypothetical protein